EIVSYMTTYIKAIKGKKVLLPVNALLNRLYFVFPAKGRITKQALVRGAGDVYKGQLEQRFRKHFLLL
ncbi:hypothetical protein LKL48_15695, partial [Listeria monocytogenes]